MRPLLGLLVLAAGCAGAPLAYRRVYHAGVVERYELRSSSTVNGAPRGTAVAVSVHELGPSEERIHFEKLEVPPYTVSLQTGALALPSLAGLDPAAVGMVTDLHTFLVAISPSMGVTHLRRPGDVYVRPEPATGSWSSGQDCTQVTMKLVALDAREVTIETSFDPPARACLVPRAPFMEAPVAGGPNNFQQVRKGDDGLSPMWGRERFVVRSVVRRSDGRILHATMDNELTLRARLRCDESLERCAGEAPVTLRRSLELTALSR